MGAVATYFVRFEKFQLICAMLSTFSAVKEIQNFHYGH